MLRHDPIGGWVFGGERLELSTKASYTIKSLITVLKMLTSIQQKLRHDPFYVISMREMTSKVRMNKAMNLEKPDRVPVMCQMSIGHMLLQTNFSPSEFWFSTEVFSEGLLNLRKFYDFDGILISLYGHSSNWEKNIKKFQTEEDREVIHWKSGDKTIFPRDDLPLHYPTQKKVLPSLSDFDPGSIPEEIDYIPVSQGITFSIDREHPYDILDIICKKAGEPFSIHCEVTSPFDYFLNLFGHKEALVYLLEEPSKSKEILQRYTLGIIKIAKEQIKHSIDAIKISSPYAGSGFISPKFYREFILPYERQIAQSVRENDIFVYTHTCGTISDRLEMMVEAGISGLECLDPPPLGDVRLADAKRRVGRKVFIKGNMDPIHTLLQGNRETILKDAKSRIEIGKPGGGFILSTACSIAPYTKKENVQVLMKAAEEYGYY